MGGIITSAWNWKCPHSTSAVRATYLLYNDIKIVLSNSCYFSNALKSLPSTWSYQVSRREFRTSSANFPDKPTYSARLRVLDAFLSVARTWRTRREQRVQTVAVKASSKSGKWANRPSRRIGRSRGPDDSSLPEAISLPRDRPEMPLAGGPRPQWL